MHKNAWKNGTGRFCSLPSELHELRSHWVARNWHCSFSQPAVQECWREYLWWPPAPCWQIQTWGPGPSAVPDLPSACRPRSTRKIICFWPRTFLTEPIQMLPCLRVWTFKRRLCFLSARDLNAGGLIEFRWIYLEQFELFLKSTAIAILVFNITSRSKIIRLAKHFYM